jgi:hypothetical protein
MSTDTDSLGSALCMPGTDQEPDSCGSAHSLSAPRSTLLMHGDEQLLQCTDQELSTLHDIVGPTLQKIVGPTLGSASLPRGIPIRRSDPPNAGVGISVHRSDPLKAMGSQYAGSSPQTTPQTQVLGSQYAGSSPQTTPQTQDFGSQYAGSSPQTTPQTQVLGSPKRRFWLRNDPPNAGFSSNDPPNDPPNQSFGGSFDR